MLQISNHLEKTERKCQDFLQKVKIDSFKLRIATEKVTIISTTFREKFQKLYLTGEIDADVSLENHKTDISKGITSRMGYAVSRHGKEETEVFYFQLNAKMCQRQYFDGIGQDTIRLVYDYIIALNVVYVPYGDFLEGYVSDIDFACDVAIMPKNLGELNQRLFEKVIESKQRYVDKPFRRQDNVGIAFNRREKATPTRPFIKIYHKGLELQSKTKEFYDAYLSGIYTRNVGRLEYTLKNSKHQKHLGIKIKTLNELLAMDKTLLESIVLSGIKENYIETGLRNIDYSELCPVEKILKYYMEDLISLGRDKKDLYGALDVFEMKYAKGRVSRGRMMKLISSLIEDSGQKERLDKNEEMANAIRAFGLSGCI